MNSRSILATLVMQLLPFSAIGADLAGLWQQLDDDGKTSALIRIVESDRNVYEGVVEEIFPEAGEPENPLCTHCTGELHNRPILGMRIISGIKRKDANGFDSGTILDPDNGKIYRCSMELAPDGKQLKVTGSIGPAWLGRAEVWHKVK